MVCNSGKVGKLGAGVFVVSLFVAGFFVSVERANAFGIRAAFRHDAQFFSVLFDGTIASSTVASSSAILNAGSPAVVDIMTSDFNPVAIFGSASGTINVGDKVTVSSSVQNISNATNTSIEAQKLLPALKIASVRAGLGSNNLDEYVSLYSQMGTA